MNNGILPHTLAVFAVGSTLVSRDDLRPTYDTKKYYAQERWNVTKTGHQYHTESCICHVAKKMANTCAIFSTFYGIG